MVKLMYLGYVDRIFMSFFRLVRVCVCVLREAMFLEILKLYTCLVSVRAHSCVFSELN